MSRPTLPSCEGKVYRRKGFAWPTQPEASSSHDWPVSRIELFGVSGLPEVRPGADLSRMIADVAQVRDGDVVELDGSTGAVRRLEAARAE